MSNALLDEPQIAPDPCLGSMMIVPNRLPHQPFRCPICGREEYEAEIHFTQLLNERTTGYHCVGCTVRFTDPERFGARHGE